MKTIALIGNPNVGKTSLFNRLTNLKQKTGNYPGITVEKREGVVSKRNKEYRIVDLPGTYTIFPDSADEEVVFSILSDKNNELHPDLVIIVSDPSTLKRGIILYQQIREMRIPAIFVVNMVDELEDIGISINFGMLEQYLKTKVYQTNARAGKGINDLIKGFEESLPAYFDSLSIPIEYNKAVDETKRLFPLATEYITWQYLAQEKIPHLAEGTQKQINEIRAKYNIASHVLQKQESLQRGEKIEEVLQSIIQKGINKSASLTAKIDKVLLHPILGYIIFFTTLLLIFQAIYSWSAPLMDGIDTFFSWLTAYLEVKLPEGPLSSLFINGIVAGIGGIVIFLPQIAILFLLISLMEESGYMSRIVFLMDRWLRPFGLNGKSIIPLVSGAACAIPAVMSARNIENPKERLLTMLVTPFMTCSARLPIYIVLISLVIPDNKIFGFSTQGLALLGLYILGFVMALISAWILNNVIKSVNHSFLIFELPKYKGPDWRNVGITVWGKASGFLLNAGKIILAISVILWVLGSFGPNDKFSNAEKYVIAEHTNVHVDLLDKEIAAYQLEHSYLGYIGRFIEPAISPLGYDWKMGIGLISSFAAREVFVATMAVVYSLGGDIDLEEEEQKSTLLTRMKSEINRNTGKPAYTFASGLSLLLFYAFAMQCMATIAVVRKETGSWKWTLLQLFFMTGIAYAAAFITYQLLK